MTAAPLHDTRIVLVNWRDRGHGLAGGAEEYAVRVAGSLADAGAQVTFLTARDAGQAPRTESIAMTTIRRGGRWTVYLWALLWLAANRRRIDVVVDCQNGIPFFSPLVLARRTRVVLLMHHVHDAQFGVHFPVWLARIGRWLEGPAARWVYRGATTVAVSPSTVHAMRTRLGWRGPVYVVPNGMTEPRTTDHVRASAPRVVCLGRLVTHKRVDRLITAVGELRARWPGLELHVIGGGPQERELRAAAARLDGVVRVHGYVDEKTKADLLGDAWLNVTLSDGEGWGLAVVEAAAYGVPTLCRRVDGLRDSVRPGETGWLMAEDADLVAELDTALRELADPARATEVARACREWASSFDWPSTGRRFTALVDGLRRGLTPGSHEDHEAVLVEYSGAEPAIDLLGVRRGPGWLLAEQRTADELAASLREVNEVSYRAADDVERLLGAPVRLRGQPVGDRDHQSAIRQ